MQKGRHLKHVEEAVVPWVSGQVGELGTAHYSRYLRMEDAGLEHLLDVHLSYWENSGKWLVGAVDRQF